MIIDAHAHLWCEDWLPDVYWDELAERMASIRMRQTGEKIPGSEMRKRNLSLFNDPTGERLIAEMDEAGIDKTIILPLDYGLALGEAKVSIEEVNKRYAEISQKYPDKIVAFAGIDPRRENAVSFIEKGVKEWGMKGLKLYPPAGFYLNEKQLYPIYKKASELNIPVIAHTGQIFGTLKSKYAYPSNFDEVSADFPDLVLVAAHMGFGWWSEVAWLISKRLNIKTDFSGWNPLAYSSPQTFRRTLRTMIDIAGINSIMFGTDGPAYRTTKIQNKDWVQIIKGLPNQKNETTFSQDEVESLLWKNAQSIYRI
jgi:predicted TIM-barrel fold metal-dependent hydrolase